MCSSCAPDGSRESVKCQVRQEACVPSWNNQLKFLQILFILLLLGNSQQVTAPFYREP